MIQWFFPVAQRQIPDFQNILPGLADRKKSLYKKPAENFCTGLLPCTWLCWNRDFREKKKSQGQRNFMHCLSKSGCLATQQMRCEKQHSQRPYMDDLLQNLKNPNSLEDSGLIPQSIWLSYTFIPGLLEVLLLKNLFFPLMNFKNILF